MSPRMRVAAAGLLFAVAVGVIRYWYADGSGGDAAPVGPVAVSEKSNAATDTPLGSGPRQAPPDGAEDYPLVAGLLDPAGSAQRDLAIVALVLEAWQSNFPGQGNPVGENVEITAALTGRNQLRLDLIPNNHPAISRAGDLCDRWGTPLFFHQLSGTQMELRSAGPDRLHHTDDDVVWTP